jgi:DNA-binding response OmpR family regulator
MNVLVVDDDPLTRKLLRFLLSEEGFAVWTARDAAEAADVVRREEVDLVVLDAVLPGVDGVQFCRRLRDEGHPAPVIFLTARADLSDRVDGLQAGADDYLGKPFAPAELIARVRAVLRRYRRSRVATRDVRLHAGGIVLDVGELRVRLPGQKVAHLTHSEMKVLRCLMASAGAVVPRGALADALWGCDGAGGGDQISVYVRRLRKKIEADPDRPRYIESVRARGYRLRPPQ